MPRRWHCKMMLPVTAPPSHFSRRFNRNRERASAERQCWSQRWRGAVPREARGDSLTICSERDSRPLPKAQVQRGAFMLTCSRRRDRHSAAPFSHLSRCFNMDGEGGAGTMAASPTAGLTRHQRACRMRALAFVQPHHQHRPAGGDATVLMIVRRSCGGQCKSAAIMRRSMIMNTVAVSRGNSAPFAALKCSCVISSANTVAALKR